jgi:hypothetical protein
MQEDFCRLRLMERRALGNQLLEARAKLDSGGGQDMGHASARFDSKPDALYIVAATQRIARAEILKRASYLLTGGLASYGKTQGTIVIDRDGEGFEFEMIANFQPSPEHLKLGECIFGKVRVSSYQGSIGPSLRRFEDNNM